MSEALIASRAPFAVDVEQGRSYWWCACGRSKSQPYCDGSHKGSGLTPVQFTAGRSEKVWLCGCKRSGHAPKCDGTHNKLPQQSASA